MFKFAQVTIISSSSSIIHKLSGIITNFHNFLLFIVALVIGLLIGGILAGMFKKIAVYLGHRADKAINASYVRIIKRTETLLVLSSALIRLLVVLISIYVWWVLTHNNHQSSLLIGASALVIVVAYGFSGPVLRDIAFGGSMMAEQWFGVGDIVTLQPNNMQGVVEHTTLRSTKIRGFSGETIWYSNQNINMVSVVKKGTWAIALEIFVNNPTEIDELVQQTNQLLPLGSSLIISPLIITKKEKTGQDIWHITVVGETAPGRDSLITNNAVDVLVKLDQQQQSIILVEIVSRFVDRRMENQFARAVNNARKTQKNLTS